jgi:FkbM family methyltransferase
MIKNTIKQILKKIPIAFTQNQRYDAETKKVIAAVCKSNTNCIDVGCHKGEVFDIMIKYAPEGIHCGFEPIPNLFENLLLKYRGTTHRIYNIALSIEEGFTTFNYVISNPSYSGIKKRNYDRPHEEDTTITVPTNLLDNVIPANMPIGLIKIDVEGGEFGVLKGGIETIKRNKPVIIFEHGLGASDVYQTTPKDVFELLTGAGLNVSNMRNWLKKKPPFSLKDFENAYYNKEYYFIAYP